MVALTWIAGCGSPATFVYLPESPSSASAQLGGSGLTVFMDLKQVAVGKYADYAVRVGARVTGKMRFALVARDAGDQTLEVVVEPMLAGGVPAKTTYQTTIDGDRKSPHSMKRMLVQQGSAEPIDVTAAMPGEGTSGGRREPAANVLLGKEDIRVVGGSFHARHYQTRGGEGGATDTWSSDAAPPFGLVKLVGDYPPGTAPPPLAGNVTTLKYEIELVGLGGDAKSTITGPVRLFNSVAPNPIPLPAALEAGVCPRQGREEGENAPGHDMVSWTYISAEDGFRITLPSKEWIRGSMDGHPKELAFKRSSPRMLSWVPFVRRGQNEGGYEHVKQTFGALIGRMASRSWEITNCEGTNAAGHRYLYTYLTEPKPDGSKVAAAHSITWIEKTQTVVEVMFEAGPFIRLDADSAREIEAIESAARSICSSIE